MPNPNCLVNNLSTIDGVDVTGGSSVTITLADAAGVSKWTITCISTDDARAAAQINAGLAINNLTKTATFTAPNTGNGAALIFESTVNNGVNHLGLNDPSLRVRFGVFVQTNAGLRVGALDERTEGSAAHGWMKKVNAGIRYISANQLPASVTPDANKLLLRGPSGEGFVTELRTGVIHSASGGLSISATGAPTVTLDNGLNEMVVNGSIRAAGVKAFADTQLTRWAPFRWQARVIGGAIGWSVDTDTTGYAECLLTDSTAILDIPLEFPHGVRLDEVMVQLKGAGTSAQPLPDTPPVVRLISELAASLIPDLLAQEIDGSGTPAAYRDTPHNIVLVPGTEHIVDAVNNRYRVQVKPEAGTNALTGMLVYGVRVKYTFKAGSVFVGQ